MSPHPSGSSQCTSPEHPVSCIKPGLAIHFTYDNIHASMPFSRFRMGNTCTPVADSCQCMIKPIQYCKVISLQKIINKLKKKKSVGLDYSKPVKPW